MDTPASPTKGEIVPTIFLYSSSSSWSDNRCPEATNCLISGFLAMRDGFVVWPSRNPNKLLTRRVSSGSPPSTSIFVFRRSMRSSFRLAYALSSVPRKLLGAKIIFIDAGSHQHLAHCGYHAWWAGHVIDRPLE